MTAYIFLYCASSWPIGVILTKRYVYHITDRERSVMFSECTCVLLGLAATLPNRHFAFQAVNGFLDDTFAMSCRTTCSRRCATVDTTRTTVGFKLVRDAVLADQRDAYEVSRLSSFPPLPAFLLFSAPFHGSSNRSYSLTT